VVRNAAVSALAPLHPTEAAWLWSDHPSVEISLGLADIGKASRERRSIDSHAFAMIDDAAIKSPLSPQPFLVRGVQAQLAGDTQGAKDAFLAAQWRDPRSMPAAYFLADYYFNTGDALRGLTQAALLARLSPGGVGAIAPFVAAYAQDQANWPRMRALFRSQQGLEDGVLMALASDARNAQAILAISDPGHRTPDAPWLPILLNSLVRSGDFAAARSIWSSIGRANAGSALIYDANFTSPAAPPPFNWTLAASTVGLAERQPGKGLHVIFYGNEDGVLASELLVLPAGTYNLRMALVGSPVHPEALRWSIRCAQASEPAASIGVNQAAARGWTFEVPANCPAQWLELSGSSGEISQQADVTIGPLRLIREGKNA
jgi:hypothetical protein